MWPIFSRISKSNKFINLYLQFKYITHYCDDNSAKTLSSTQKNMFVKVFLVLETWQTIARITTSDLMSALSQYSILLLQSSITIDFGWQKNWGAMPPPAPRPPVSPALIRYYKQFIIFCSKLKIDCLSFQYWYLQNPKSNYKWNSNNFAKS